MEKKTWQYDLILFLGRFIQLLPYSWLLIAGSCLGGLLYSLSGRHRERGIRHIMETLEYSEKDAHQLIKKMYRHLGKSALEILYTPKLMRNPKLIAEIIEYDISDTFMEHVQSGKGGIFITAHYGNWEWLAMGVAAKGIQVGTIVKNQPQPWVNALLNGNRRLTHVEVFPRTNSGKEILSGIRSIKKGKFLGLLCDQDGGKDGLVVSFLGKPASTMAGPGIIAAKTGGIVYSAFIQRTETGGHRIRIGEPLIHSEDSTEITVAIQKEIERVIREKPEEWLWLQRRWNTPIEEKEGAHE